MTTKNRLDVRADQLKLLKLERREMRGMAATLLNASASKSMKRTAIAAAVAAVIAVHGAPSAYAQKISADTDSVVISAAAIAAVCNSCEGLSSVIEANADLDQIHARLAALFAIIDAEHARYESLAKAVGARLLSVDESDIGGGGGNKGLTAWLTQSVMSAR